MSNSIAITLATTDYMIMYGSRKYPHSPHGRSLKLPRGRGVLKAKPLEEEYKANLEFLGGGGGEGLQNKNLPWGGGSMDIFWNYTIVPIGVHYSRSS